MVSSHTGGTMIGSRLAHYEILELQGAGGMGAAVPPS